MPQCRAGQSWIADVPGRDRTRSTRAPSPENAAPMESNKRVPQTPSRQPVTKPAVKPPMAFPSHRKLTPSKLACQLTSMPSCRKRISRDPGTATPKECFSFVIGDEEFHDVARSLAPACRRGEPKTMQRRRAVFAPRDSSGIRKISVHTSKSFLASKRRETAAQFQQRE